MADLVIRKAREEDLPAISTLWFEMMNYHLAQDRRFAIANDAGTIFQTWVRGLIKDAEVAYVAVAEEKGVVVGYILGQIEDLPPVYTFAKIGVIRDVCVIQGARHHGLGSKMFEHSQGWFEKRGVGAIWVRIPIANTAAGKFWEELGFTPLTLTLRKEMKPGTD